MSQELLWCHSGLKWWTRDDESSNIVVTQIWCCLIWSVLSVLTAQLCVRSSTFCSAQLLAWHTNMLLLNAEEDLEADLIRTQECLGCLMLDFKAVTQLLPHIHHIFLPTCCGIQTWIVLFSFPVVVDRPHLNISKKKTLITLDNSQNSLSTDSVFGKTLWIIYFFKSSMHWFFDQHLEIMTLWIWCDWLVIHRLFIHPVDTATDSQTLAVIWIHRLISSYDSCLTSAG